MRGIRLGVQTLAPKGRGETGIPGTGTEQSSESQAQRPHQGRTLDMGTPLKWEIRISRGIVSDVGTPQTKSGTQSHPQGSFLRTTSREPSSPHGYENRSSSTKA